MVVLMPLFAAALFVHRRYFTVAPRPFPAAPLVVHRRCLIVAPMPLPHCASQVLDHGAKADARGTTLVLGCGVQAAARGAARYASQVRRRYLCVAGYLIGLSMP